MNHAKVFVGLYVDKHFASTQSAGVVCGDRGDGRRDYSGMCSNISIYPSIRTFKTTCTETVHFVEHLILLH